MIPHKGPLYESFHDYSNYFDVSKMGMLRSIFFVLTGLTLSPVFKYFRKCFIGDPIRNVIIILVP